MAPLFNWTIRFSLVIVLSILIGPVSSIKYGSITCNAFRKPSFSLQCTRGSFLFVETSNPQDAVAWGSFDDTIASKGFASLIISSNSSFSSKDQMFASGYLEGRLTSARIEQSFINNREFLFVDWAPAGAFEQGLAFVQRQRKWIEAKIAKHDTTENRYWLAAQLLLAQADGLTAGYWSAPSHSHPLPAGVDAFFLSSLGSMPDIIPKLFPEKRQNCWDSVLPSQTDPSSGRVSAFGRTIPRFRHEDHCSVLIKPIRNNASEYVDLFFFHNSWFDYRTSLRIIKSFHLALADTTDLKVTEHNYVMTSYPSFLQSHDDFFLISGDNRSLFVTETTNDICDGRLFDLVAEQAMQTWQRAWIANLLSKNGKEWTAVASLFNNGAYNNQFMIVNGNLFTPGQKKLAHDLFWIVEAMPGKVESKDMTSTMEENTYWASYNRPFFSDQLEEMGYVRAASVYGDFFTHENSCRAKIFRARQGKVQTMAELRDLSIYNDYQHDPLSLGSPWCALAARGDRVQNPPKVPWMEWALAGATDAKVVNFNMLNNMELDIIIGPTHAQQPVFSFKAFPQYSHMGMPDSFNFDWEHVSLHKARANLTDTHP
eukprot:TRINITY_DN5963_c0_g1_i1.p1 TRINITY_DN5963_c0_g1~~TRINITY_DN5963_c0_g1_i1.p1  ORF type:complete len:597 (-),score=88.68 TRINITY_DN5963_c0_g1_i1:252-2042(-)